MKHFITAALLLAATVAFCIFSSHTASRISLLTEQYLEKAEKLAIEGDFSGAGACVDKMLLSWKKHSSKMEFILRADDIDAVSSNMLYISSALKNRDTQALSLHISIVLQKLSDISDKEAARLVNLF